MAVRTAIRLGSDRLTANELLSFLGRAWWPLLVYPGGLTAFALVGLLGRFERSASPIHHSPDLFARVSAVAAPWLALALTPLPSVVNLGRPLDAVALLALLEWPLLLAVATALTTGDKAAWQAAGRRVAAVLNGYPSLLLALLALAWSGGSLQLTTLASPPDDLATLTTKGLHWFGAVTLALALPPVLGLGPFAAPPPGDLALRIGLRLRLLGYLALAVLPWFPLPGDNAWLRPLPPIVIALLLWLFNRIAKGGTRRWAVAYNVFAAVQLLALLGVALDALRLRVT
ncbi:MAG TPA: hypothetical protein VFT66_08170 [Roseiflexaceae bacterium]|nr:hypothetical protein [Roseiflexaceae bacterium]